MVIKIIATGKVKNRCIADMIADYSERISHDARITFLTVKDAYPQAERRTMLGLLARHPGYVFALSEEGRLFSSEAFARALAAITRPALFLIGGPFGLDSAVKQRADQLLSLSPMTFSHEMAQLLVLEQIYRALSINLNRAYHKP
jgi:23S rRNA (pseudouridine1915-N3)-methyltransferase